LGRAQARVRGSSAATDEALATYEDTVLRALEETESSFATYHAEEARLIKLNDQARESKRAADIARLRYREGVIDFLSLLDAERTQLQAEHAVAQANETCMSRSSRCTRLWAECPDKFNPRPSES
jgi:outer membrane protein, multidrug efflux system